MNFGTHYAFSDRWRVSGSVEQVADVLLDTLSISEWWPQLALAEVCEPGYEDGLHRRFRSRARGFMPYVLDLEFRVIHVQFPKEFVVEVTGALAGRGRGLLSDESGTVRIDFELQVGVQPWWLRCLSYLLRPLLVLQHRWVMRQGQHGIVRELSRRGVWGTSAA